MRDQQIGRAWEVLPLDKGIVNAALARLMRALDAWQLEQARQDMAFQGFIAKLEAPGEGAPAADDPSI